MLFLLISIVLNLSPPWLCVWVCIHDAGMTKVEEKLKAGRVKRQEGSGFSEEPQRRPAGTPNHPSKKDPATTSSGEHSDQLLICELISVSDWIRDYFATVHSYTLALTNTSINCKTRAIIFTYGNVWLHYTINLWLSDRLTLLLHVSKVQFLTPNGSEQSQSEVKWFVPPVPLLPGKQSMASRNTWRFARRSVNNTAVVRRGAGWVHCHNFS